MVVLCFGVGLNLNVPCELVIYVPTVLVILVIERVLQAYFGGV